MEYMTFYNGVKMPMLGYGVCATDATICTQCVLDALKAGYRMFDTAQSYENEQCLGEAFEKYGIDRKELFIATKVRPRYYDPQKPVGSTYNSVIESMKKLRTDYIDMVLLHQPYGDIYGAWRDLERLYEEGKVRVIGVSNFYEDRIVELACLAKIKPMVNQIERNPVHQRASLMEWNSKMGIETMAWAPFGRGRGGMLDNPMLMEIGAKYGKTAAQVILRWCTQTGVATIPKSTNPERMALNLDIFDFQLSEEDLAAIAALETGKSVFYSHQDPAFIEKYNMGTVKNRG